MAGTKHRPSPRRLAVVVARSEAAIERLKCDIEAGQARLRAEQQRLRLSRLELAQAERMAARRGGQVRFAGQEAN